MDFGRLFPYLCFFLQLQAAEKETKRLQMKVKNLESQLLLDKKINEAKEECNQIRRTSVMAASNFSLQQRLNDNRVSPVHPRAISERGALLSPVNGSLLSNNSSLFNTPLKQTIPEKSEQDGVITQRVDSRAVKSRTCVVM